MVEPDAPRVLHLISSLTVGGAERLLIDFARSAATKPEIPQVLVVVNNLVDMCLASDIQEVGWPVYFFCRPEGHTHPKYLFKLNQLVREHRINVIHAHDNGSKIAAVVSKALAPNLKVAFTVHDVGAFANLSKTQLRIHRYFVDATVAISAAVERECRAALLRRVYLIHNGIRVEHFRREVRKRTGAAARLISVARLIHKKKGQDILLRAVRRCLDVGLDVTCDFVGSVAPSDPRSLPELLRLSSELGLEERVHFIQNRTDIPDLLSKADIFVLPSRYEGFGLVILEAMAAGLPVVASAIDGPAELVRHGDNGLLFKFESDTDLAEQLRRLIQDPELAYQLAVKAERDVQSFDIGCMRDRYYDMYRSIREGCSSVHSPDPHGSG